MQEIAYDMCHGGSLYGSQGDCNASETFAEILQRIRTLGKEKTKPLEKARILLKLISMLKDWCDLNTLGVRSLREEFRRRYKEYASGGQVPFDQVPKLVTTLPDYLRLVPLYLPTPASDTCLYFTQKIEGTNDFDSRYILLFIDANGFIVRFTSKHHGSKNCIGFSHEVCVDYIKQDVVAEYLGRHPLMFDYCIRSLISLCLGSIQRAEQRAASARQGMGALVLIGEEMRRGDFTAAILLSHEEHRGMGDCRINVDIFRRIVGKAGVTPEERTRAIREQMEILHCKDITDISQLSLEATMAVINEP